MAETWRVVLASGEVLGVATPQGTRGDATRVAIARNCALWHWPVAEILAPGELTRAELRAQAFREGAEAMRAEAAEVAAGSWATHPAHRGMCAASRAVADEILSLPVPPCPEVSR